MLFRSWRWNNNDSIKEGEELRPDVEENLELITIDSIKNCKESKLDVEEKLEAQAECCIYRVPKELRKMNEEAYTPQVISIGPLHYGEEELTDMEKQKIRFVREFCSKRIQEQTWQEFITFIKGIEQRIRNCYVEMPKRFKKLDFIAMILYDAVFIFECLLRGYPRFQSDDLFLRPVTWTIWTDLLLLENQLPYFVLEELYKLAFSQHGRVYPSFFSLSFKFACYDMLSNMSPEVVINQINELRDVEIKHFTDLRRYFITKIHHAEPKSFIADKDLPCAVKLHESGVKFERFEGAESFLNIRVKKKKLLRIPWLSYRELQIPLFEVYDQTECLIRNLMAFEKCHYPDETHVCNYIDLMDRLINTVEDVNLLVEAGIISNCVGDTDRIAKMFNELCLHINLSDSCYYEIEKVLQKHYNYRWNHAKATLRSVYFSNRWRGTATIAAILLLVLTMIQTICSIKSAV